MSAVIGAVVIGRNEGERLARCLTALRGLTPRVVYVDSDSTDDSIQLAGRLGATVVRLDTSDGFTAARARNAGWRRLTQLHPDVQFVQFVDGDCQLADGWLGAATAALEHDARLAVVSGRLRERHPNQSIYNRLCDMEWNTPVGDAKACGGNAMIRVEALSQVGGFDDRVIAGEEPELCVRLRRQTWRIRRLDTEMGWHDAAMTRLSQWIRRNRRAGHACAEAFAMHGGPPERMGVRPTRSIWFWAFLWPLLAIGLTTRFGPIGLISLLAYPLMLTKITASRRRQFGEPWSHCWLYGCSCMLAKWPQLAGQLRFLRTRLQGKKSTIIEYKSEPSKPS